MGTQATVENGPLGGLWRDVQTAASARGLVARIFRNNSGWYRHYGSCHLAVIDPARGTTYSTRSAGLLRNWELGGGPNLEVRGENTILGATLRAALTYLTTPPARPPQSVYAGVPLVV